MFDAEGLSDSSDVQITVSDDNVNQAPVAIVSATPISGDAPLEVNFTGSDSFDDAGIVSYFWEFGDGTTSEEVNPIYIYTEVGVFDATLTVFDAEGLSDTATVVINVDENVNQANNNGEFEIVIGQNPTQGSFAFISVFNEPEDVTLDNIYIFDSARRLVATYNPADVFINDRYEIPVFGLRTEYYYVFFEFSDEIRVVRMIVNN